MVRQRGEESETRQIEEMKKEGEAGAGDERHAPLLARCRRTFRGGREW